MDVTQLARHAVSAADSVPTLPAGSVKDNV